MRMATRRGPIRATNVRVELLPDYRKIIFDSADGQRYLRTLVKLLGTRYTGNIRMDVARERAGYSIRTDTKRGFILTVGTSSSFAHWEEFGSVRWEGPIAPLRRALAAYGLTWHDPGKNSQKGNLEHPLPGA